VNRLLPYGKVSGLASISSEQQVLITRVDVALIIAARLPFSVGKRRKSVEELERKLLSHSDDASGGNS
jgi:hypothetical protein